MLKILEARTKILYWIEFYHPVVMDSLHKAQLWAQKPTRLRAGKPCFASKVTSCHAAFILHLSNLHVYIPGSVQLLLYFQATGIYLPS